MKVFALRLVLLIIVAFSPLACEGFDEQLLYNRGTEAHDKGNYAEAIRIYNSLIARDPENKIHPNKANVRYDLGMAYLDAHDRRRALEQVEALRKMNREDLANELDGAMKSQEL